MRRLVVKENLIGSAKPPVNRQTSCFFIYGGIITTQGVKKNALSLYNFELCFLLSSFFRLNQMDEKIQCLPVLAVKVEIKSQLIRPGQGIPLLPPSCYNL